MKVIRSENQKGDKPAIDMLPVLVQWGMRDCNLKDCTNKATTIVTGLAGLPFGMCEEHYQQAVTTKGKYKFEIEI